MFDEENGDSGVSFTTHRSPCKPLQKHVVQSDKLEKEHVGELRKVDKELSSLRAEFRMFILMKYGKPLHDKVVENSNPGLDDELKKKKILGQAKKNRIYDLVIRLLIVTNSIILTAAGAYFVFNV